MPKTAKLALEDGTVFSGDHFGAEGEVDGEVCFNTSMTGYQEILTDPSYRGQIVAMTYPEIGNYGVNAEDVESWKPHLAGFVVREQSRRVSSFRADGPLHDYLCAAGIVALEGIDTRALVRRLRIHGAMKGVLSTKDLDDLSLVAKAQASPGLLGRDLVREVIPERGIGTVVPTETGSGLFQGLAHLGTSRSWTSADLLASPGDRSAPPSPHVVALDYGMKWNIARHLFHMGCRVTVLPGSATADEILALKPNGVFLSNGPGDPEPLDYAQRCIRGLLGKIPLFGICLGHQLLALACGARTYKLKFGHRGANQPVMNCATNRVEITSQNHGFAVDPESLPSELEVTHLNLNDGTVEGLRHRTLPAFSVQYHPEASAGPHDSRYLFDQFDEMLV
ncbi:MAG: glutamine-hydrolyzing carbamoyl-phosphate synthase small subunit [Thermoguttaceae bacterium]|jgi:carbamoyl-phosphate synthase small subunit|nr:glutamine-hydrolyzing carbamoyl-phosphate synthase small subunit [Thermoguttaceae bacterium]